MNSETRCFLFRRVMPGLALLAAAVLLLFLLGDRSWHPLIRQFQRQVYGPEPYPCYEDVWLDKVQLMRDSANRVVRKDNLSSRATWMWAYDAAGRVVQEHTPVGAGRQWVYDDKLGRLSQYEDSWGTKIRMDYEPDGRLKALVDEETGKAFPPTDATMQRILPPQVDAEGCRSPPLTRDADQPIRLTGPLGPASQTPALGADD